MFNNSRNEVDYFQLVREELSKKPLTIACIIPDYNEGDRIKPVLDVVTNYDLFDEKIVVNDGSTDNTSEILKSYPSITVIEHPTNYGKAKALKSGISAVKSELIVILDADLIGLTSQDLNKLIYPVISGSSYMTILDRAGDRKGPFGYFSSFLSRIIGGERAFWKSDFEKINFNENVGYAIEGYMNEYYVKNGLKIKSIYSHDLFCPHQTEKKGVIKGWIYALKVFKQCTSEVNLIQYFSQFSNIEEDNLSSFYKLYFEHKNIFTYLLLLVAALLASIMLFLYNVVRSYVLKLQQKI